MKTVYYCQHVLGIGHFHRSLEICRAIAATGPVSLILGGPPVQFDTTGLEVFHLPGLKMDPDFNNLIPCDPATSLVETKTLREKKLYDFFFSEKPDVFITELYPFGRKAFRFELDPILGAIKNGTLSPCKILCSVRDILVEKKTGHEKFESRVVNTLNRYFDGILIHSDPAIIRLDQTFSRFADIAVPCYYTGFVSKRSRTTSGDAIREELGIASGEKLIVASIGGGSVGGELLEKTIAACRILEQSSMKIHLQLFGGPYCPEELYRKIANQCSERFYLNRFTDRFVDWLRAADLSISMAGYNSCMDLAATGVPALVHPFRQNREQHLRAVAFALKLPITVLHDHDLTPDVLAKEIRNKLKVRRSTSDINLRGAEETAQLVRTIQGGL